MSTVETVKVVADNEQGFIIINKSDLKDQTEYKPKASKKATKPKIDPQESD